VFQRVSFRQGLHGSQPFSFARGIRSRSDQGASTALDRARLPSDHKPRDATRERPEQQPAWALQVSQQAPAV
jgi:hypothetical protein